MTEISSGLRRAATRTEGVLGALVRSSAPAAVVAEAVRSVVDAASNFDDAIGRATALEIQETMKGPAIVLCDADPEDMLPVLERLGEQFDDAGLPDTLLTVLPTANPWGRDPERLIAGITCWTVIRGARPAGWTGAVGWPVEQPYWQVDVDDQLAAVGELVDWAVSLPGRGAVAAVTSGTTFVPVPLSSAMDFVHRTEERLTWRDSNKLLVTAGSDFRSVDLLSRYGLAAAAVGVRNGEELNWRHALDQSRDLATRLGQWCTHAHLTRGRGSMTTSVLQPDGDRTIANPWASRSHDWADFVSSGEFFDAYGVMRLTADQRRVVEPLWNVTPLPTGQILAEHSNLPAWFSEPRVDSAALRQARATLGDALIDRTNERLRD